MHRHRAKQRVHCKLAVLLVAELGVAGIGAINLVTGLELLGSLPHDGEEASVGFDKHCDNTGKWGHIMYRRVLNVLVRCSRWRALR